MPTSKPTSNQTPKLRHGRDRNPSDLVVTIVSITAGLTHLVWEWPQSAWAMSVLAAPRCRQHAEQSV